MPWRPLRNCLRGAPCLRRPGRFLADYKDDPRQSTRNLDRFEGDSDRVWATYSQYLGAIGPFDALEFSWTNFAHNSYRNFIVGLPFTPDAPPDAPRDFRVWGSEPRLSMSIDGDSVSQTWRLGARLVKEDVDFKVDRQNLAIGVVSVNRDWTFTLDGLCVSSAFTDAANSEEENADASVGELPAYWLWNTAVEREFKLHDGSLLTTSAGGQQPVRSPVLLPRHRHQPLGAPAGRTLTLGVNYRF